MKAFGLIAAALAFVMLAGVAVAADKPATKKEAPGLRGEVVKIDGVNLVIKNQEGKEITVVTDSKTEVTIEGVAGKKVADLKAGQKVMVRPAKGTAKQIQVPTAAKPKPKAKA